MPDAPRLGRLATRTPMFRVSEPSQPDWGNERQRAREPYPSNCPVSDRVEARTKPAAANSSLG